MTSRSPLVGALLLAGCAVGGGQLAHNTSAASAAPAPDAFECARNQIKAVGFTQSSYDTDELRLTARRNDETARRPDVQFRRMVDKLEVDVSPGSGGEMSRITVVARTFAELTTHRGPTEEEEKPSETVRAAAKTILDKCGGDQAPTVPDSVVPPA
jgi:hypothetical protein